MVDVGVDVMLLGGGGVAVPRGGTGGGSFSCWTSSVEGLGESCWRGGTGGGELHVGVRSSWDNPHESGLHEKHKNI